ncbi:hypothetical protein MLD38_003928 [Melastoma candidum]|uniref:Uncharacterized protein n=1 Tax=Melastoma candidum TaxID=119954 RepID=A0ACB9S4D0_9MYRT|nr:hypothetical protein MLD38_003928 [Melastoma candidum]
MEDPSVSMFLCRMNYGSFVTDYWAAKTSFNLLLAGNVEPLVGGFDSLGVLVVAGVKKEGRKTMASSVSSSPPWKKDRSPRNLDEAG